MKIDFMIQLTHTHYYIVYLDKLNLIWWFDFSQEPIFATAQATSKKYFIQKWSKNNHLGSFSNAKSKSLIHLL